MRHYFIFAVASVAVSVFTHRTEAVETSIQQKLQAISEGGGAVKLTAKSAVPAVSVLIDRQAISGAEVKGSNVAVDTGGQGSPGQSGNILVACLLQPSRPDISQAAVGELYTNVQRSDGTGAIGFDVAYCTATLVAPSVVLTAAHCLNYGSALARSGDLFKVTSVAQNIPRTYDYEVERYESLGSAPGPADLALVKLKGEVPASVAKPLELRKDAVAPATKVRIFGFGCTDRMTPTAGAYTKRSVEVPWPIDATVPILCPGDSGGPVVVIADQKPQVLAVNSAFWKSDALVAARPDVFADAVASFDVLNQAINSLSKPSVPTASVP